MRQKTNYVLIGLFVLCSAAIGVVAAILLGAGALNRNALMLETYLTESVRGLDVGAHVRFRGVKIGSVSEISLTSLEYGSEQPYVLVRFSLRPIKGIETLAHLEAIVRTRLGEGLRIRLGSQGLTGALYLEADLYENADETYPPIQHEWTPGYRYVPSIPSTIVQLSTALEDVLSNLQKADLAGLIDDARTMLRSLDEAISGTDLAALSSRVERTLEGADRTIEQASSAVERIARSGDELVARVRDRVVAVPTDAVPMLLEDVQRFTAQLQPATDAVESAATTIGSLATEVSASVDATLRETRLAMSDLRAAMRTKNRDVDTILATARRAATSFANLADTLEQYPSLLLLGNPPAERTRR